MWLVRAELRCLVPLARVLTLKPHCTAKATLVCISLIFQRDCVCRFFLVEQESIKRRAQRKDCSTPRRVTEEGALSEMCS